MSEKQNYTYDPGDNLVTKTISDTSTQIVFQYNTANELTRRTENGVQTNMAYNVWGDMTSRTQGGYSANYVYRYGGKLSSVTSNFPGESNVSYEYRGDGKRHSRTAGGVTTRYGWDMGWNVIHEESAGGTLQKSYVSKRPVKDVFRIHYLCEKMCL